MPEEKLEITVPEDDLLEFLATRYKAGKPIIPDKYTITDAEMVLGEVTFTVVRVKD